MAMSSSITRFTDVHNEPVSKVLAPIADYEMKPLVSLEQAIEPVAQFFNGIEANTLMAKEKCLQPKEGLTLDESAAIYLYTMQFEDGPNLFEILNQNLRAEKRQHLKPWLTFLKLFLTALYKLPSLKKMVWRGVRGVDLRSKYPKGAKVIWWGVSSCMVSIAALEDDHFVGKTGLRTLFCIECQNGKSVTLQSNMNNMMEEIILMPGSYFQVMDQFNAKEELYIIHLREIVPPYPLMATPFIKTEAMSQSSETGNYILVRLIAQLNTITMKRFASRIRQQIFV